MQDIQILLVGDNASDAEMTCHALNKDILARHLLHVKNGAAVLDFIFVEVIYNCRNIEQSPRVILLDLKIPKVNGFRYCNGYVQTNGPGGCRWLH